MLTIARNTCLDYVRSPRARARAQRLPSLEEGEADQGREGLAATWGGESELSVEEVVRQVQMSECVQQMVLSLPETLRTALLLHDVEGLTNLEAARVGNCSVEAAKMRLH